MMFSNTLVSFVAAIALASSVTASITPVRRGGGNDNNGKPTQSCTTGSLHCCDSSSNYEDQPTLIQEGLLSFLSPGVVANVPIGANCIASGVAGCDNTAFCCDGTQTMNGIANVGLNCVNA